MHKNVQTGVAAVLMIAGAAAGNTVVLTMVNGDDGGGPFNTVAFGIANLGPSNLTGWSVTVGDTQYNFDQIYATREQFVGGSGLETALLITGDRDQDGAVTDSFAYTFTNFGAGTTFRGQWDIDNDNGDFNADARLVLFNNGAAPNAVATFTFEDGEVIQYTFPDLAVLDSYTLTIPAPGAAAGLVMLGVAGLRRRR